jgi:hypothetical protein
MKKLVVSTAGLTRDRIDRALARREPTVPADPFALTTTFADLRSP